jgi:hypothetical protein
MSLMLLECDSNNIVVSVSGYRFDPDVSKKAIEDYVNSIYFVDGVPDGHTSYRVYDLELMNRIWSLLDANHEMKIIVDGIVPVDVIDLGPKEVEEPVEGE